MLVDKFGTVQNNLYQFIEISHFFFIHLYFFCSDKNLTPEIPLDCDPFLKELMEKCWHRNPDERPVSLHSPTHIRLSLFSSFSFLVFFSKKQFIERNFEFFLYTIIICADL
jgi:hypothetical protein